MATASVPVVNALSDDGHPVQVLSTCSPSRSNSGAPSPASASPSWATAVATWRGRGSRRRRSSTSTSCSPDRRPLAALGGARRARDLMSRAFTIPRAPLAGCDVVNTDVWTSMGQEAEADERSEGVRRMDARRAHAPPRQDRRDRPPLPARAPRRGDRRSDVRGPSVARVGLRQRTGCTCRRRCSSSSCTAARFPAPLTVTTRTRFAPSPTGDLHLGGAWTSLASWVVARRDSGRCVAARRRPRSTAGRARLRGAYRGGPPLARPRLGRGARAPERTRRTLRRGDGARSRRRGSSTRATARAPRSRVSPSAPHPGEESLYPGTCRDRDPARRMKRPPSLRVRVPDEVVAYDDAIVGRVEQNLAREVGDFVLRRGDGVFAYQLAVVVDDIGAGITDVVRADDLVGSTPRQIWLDAGPRCGASALRARAARRRDGRRPSREEARRPRGAGAPDPRRRGRTSHWPPRSRSRSRSDRRAGDAVRSRTRLRRSIHPVAPHPLGRAGRVVGRPIARSWATASRAPRRARTGSRAPAPDTCSAPRPGT